MEFLYVMTMMFLSIFGLVMLLRFAAEALLGDRTDKSGRKRR